VVFKSQLGNSFFGGIYFFKIFNVRPFIKIDKPQDENEGNRKIQLSQPKNPAQLKK
jgi:hypothetical protein